MRFFENVVKVYRYVKIYGLTRTLVKVLGRLRPQIKLWLFLKFPYYSSNGLRVGIIGCGHHAYSSICFFLTTSTTAQIIFGLDVDRKASSSLAYAYNALDAGSDYDCENNCMNNPDIVYISSNHATHTKYAIDFLRRGCDVYIEKPISINSRELKELKTVISETNGKVYAGYNRPHSPAIKAIRENVAGKVSPFTLSCFVTGHYLPNDHWYRSPKEGTRIVANLSHWIDLSIHMLHWRKDLPVFLDVSIAYSDIDTPSDNIAVSIVTSKSDLINLTFTSRSEPFEGVNESINFQQGDVIAKVDDFRQTQIWAGAKYRKSSYWTKNNGHKAAVMQPLDSEFRRSWAELELSTVVMLFVEEMVKSGVREKRLDLAH